MDSPKHQILKSLYELGQLLPILSKPDEDKTRMEIRQLIVLQLSNFLWREVVYKFETHVLSIKICCYPQHFDQVASRSGMREYTYCYFKVVLKLLSLIVNVALIFNDWGIINKRCRS